MNSTSALRVLLGTLLVVALGATGCSESKPEADESKAATSAAESGSDTPAEYTLSDEGYPLDRSLKGLVNFPGVDTIVVVTAPKVAEPVFIGPAGANLRLSCGSC